jgi:hypothetical protein
LLMLSVCAAEAKEEAKVAELAAGAAATVWYDKHHSKGFSKAIGSLDPKSKQFQELITHPGFLFISYCVFWATLVSPMHTLQMVMSFWKICFGISNRRWSVQCSTPVCSKWEFKFSTLLQELKLDQPWFFTAGIVYLTTSENNYQQMVSTK